MGKKPISLEDVGNSLRGKASIVIASSNYIPVEEWIRERNVISVNDDSDQVVQRPSQNARMGYTEEGRAHTHAAMALGMLLRIWDSIPPGTSSPAPCLLQERAVSKSTKGTGFAKHEIISKPCLSHIFRCVEDGAGQCEGITGIP